MASKSFSGTTDGTGNTPGYDPGTFRLSLKVSASYDEDRNQIKVNYTATYTAVVGHYNFTNGNNIKIVLNGNTVVDENPGQITIQEGQSFTLASGSKWINATEGSNKITCYAKFTQSQYSCFNVSTDTNGSITVITTIDGWPMCTVYIKIGDEWKKATPYVRVNGTWKQASNTYVKLDEK